MKNLNKCIDCGKKISKRATRCQSCANRNQTGKIHWSEKARNRRKGKNNPNWKGNKVKHTALHNWIKRRKPKPTLCERCNKNPPMDLANISGQYKRNVDDYWWLCRKCHMETDGRMKRLINELSFLGRNSRQKTTIETKCDYCGKKIIRSPYQMKRRKHQYCSVECNAKGQRKYSDKIRKKVYELWQKTDLTYRQISDKTGVPPQTIWGWLNQNKGRSSS